MRTHGTLTQWNDDRGFGFITAAHGDELLFVHISAFPKGGGRPRLNELISFETESGHDGKVRAVRVMRPGRPRSPTGPQAKHGPSQAPRRMGTVLGLLALVGIGVYGYSRFAPRPAEPPAVQVAQVPAQRSSFSCDGRTMCSQMRSCAEATYFIQHCPGTKMDGDGDGVPCEQQWCR